MIQLGLIAALSRSSRDLARCFKSLYDEATSCITLPDEAGF